jgi:metallo-beta-lactamase class B
VTIEGAASSWLVVCSLSVLPAYRLVGPDATYPGHGADYCRSLAHLETLDPDIFLAGHGDFFGLTEKRAAQRAGDARAFVDPTRYRDYLARSSSAVEQALGAQGHVGGCATLVG